MFLPRFNFPEETLSRICHKVAKLVLVKISSTKISYNIYNIYNRNLRNDAQCLERDREKKGKGNNSCHCSDQYFLPCFLFKHPTIFFQNKNGIFQHNN